MSRSLDRPGLGRRGERAAAWYLRWRGYRILARNARFGRGEIDLITRKGNTVVFVEVRTRRADEVTPPQDTVNHTKRRHLRAAARRYLAAQGQPETNYRFDVVGIVMPEQGKPAVTHLPDAFRMEE